MLFSKFSVTGIIATRKDVLALTDVIDEPSDHEENDPKK